MSHSLSVGMSQMDITPPAPVSLRGQFHTRISQSVESRLMANVFAAESAGGQIIICACDLVEVDRAFCERVRSLIQAENADIDPSSIIFCATHTHTGPAYVKKTDSLRAAVQYLPKDCRFVDPAVIPEDVWLEDPCGDYIAERLCAAVLEAWEKRRPASFCPSFGRAVVGHCRRVVYDDGSARMYGSVDTAHFRELEGGNDSGVELVYLFDADKQPMGVLANVACPAQVVEGECFISSDYWGKVRDHVKAEFGDGFVVVGLCSAAGDQSPRDQIRKNDQKARRTDPDMYSLAGAVELGRRIAGVIIGQYGQARENTKNAAVMMHKTLIVDFPLRTVTLAEYNEARRQFDECVAQSQKTVFDARDLSALHVFAGIMERYLLQSQEYFYRSEIHVARFDDIAIATNPFELFLDYGNQIRARSHAKQTLLIQLACDSGGYLPTARAERGSHYSASVSSGMTGHTGGALLVGKTLDAIQALWR